MADEGRRDDVVFFIYDHNLLKKEEDDLIDAILYFSPDNYWKNSAHGAVNTVNMVSEDDQCALCGQLMGMAEFLTATLGKSSPKVFKFEREKYAIKRVGGYSLCLQCKRNDPDAVVLKQLDHLYGVFVTFHGSLNSLRLRCKDNNNNFEQDLANIWRTILKISGVSLQSNLSKTFHHLPYIQLPKTGSHLFLQASHLLQSSQRRPYVLAGSILYKNEVVCTQLPPILTRQLTYLKVQMPYIEQKMDFGLPVGCKLCTLFLTDEELMHIFPLDPYSRRHCKVTDFSSKRKSEIHYGKNIRSAQTKLSVRRQTCPNISSMLNLYEHHEPGKTNVEESSPSGLGKSGKGPFQRNSNFIGVDRHTWGKNKTKTSLSHVPIVECRSGESPDIETQALTDDADDNYFGRSYRSSLMNQPYSLEMLKADISHSDNDSEDDGLFEAESDFDFSTHTQSVDMNSDKEHSLSNKLFVANHIKNEKIKDYKEGTVEDRKKTDEAKNGMANLDESLCDKSETVKEKSSNKFQHEAHIHAPLSDEEKTNGFILSNNLLTKDTETEGCLHKSMTNEVSVNFIDTVRVETNETVDAGCPVSEQDHVSECGQVVSNDKSTGETEIRKNITMSEISGNNNDENIVDDNTTEASVVVSDLTSESLTGKEDASKQQTALDKDENLGEEKENVCTMEVELGHRNAVTALSNAVSEGKNVDTGAENIAHEKKVIEPDKGDEEAQNLAEGQAEGNASSDMQKNGQDQKDISHNKDFQIIGKECTESESETTTDTDREEGNDKIHISPTELDTEIRNENFDSEKENIDPNNSENIGRDSKMIIKTKVLNDSGKVTNLSLNNNEKDEPCINCLDLMSENPEHNHNTCSQCLSKRKSLVINQFGDRKEVIDFLPRNSEQNSLPNQDIDQSDIEIAQTAQSIQSVDTLSSDVSTDSTISKFWTHEMDGLNDVTLYIQCHSDISLLLLMENPEQYQEDLLHALWKGSLHYLADLDFYIKECLDQKETVPAENFNFAQFNKFSRDLKENIEDLPSKRKGPFNQIVAALHSEFDYHPSFSDLTLRNQANSCYGHRSEANETFFQQDGSQRLSSGLPIPKDINYSLDNVARTKLSKERHISLM